MAAVAMTGPTVEQVSADLAIAKGELVRLQVALSEAELEFERTASRRSQKRRDELRLVRERAEVEHKHLIDRLGEAQRQALLDRRAAVRRQKAELKERSEAVADQFRAEFLQARAALMAFARLRDESRTLAIAEYDCEALIAQERRLPLQAWAVISLPRELRDWAAELLELVEVNARGSTA